MSRRPTQQGFTLIEVLVALAVLAISLSAIVRGVNQAITSTESLRDRTLALWVLQDDLALHRVRRQWPNLGHKNGTREMGGRLWDYSEDVAPSPLPELRRIEIRVKAHDGETLLSHAIGFLGSPR